RPDSQPTKAELVALLEGQTVSAAAGEQPSRAGAGPGTLTLRRIEALEIEGTTSVDSKTWSTEVSFLALAKTGRNAAGRYAVAGTVRHRLIEGKRAFLGFQAKAVVKQ